MNYTQSVNYIHERLRFGIKPGLSRVRKLLSLLGNPHECLPAIHVAGTNGKGSTCVMISRMLRSGGYKTGSYYSPYITNFRDRIQVDGEMIGEEKLAELVTRIKPHVELMEREGEEITEFELITALAFAHFKREGCDRVVLETGLGGRLDATNVVERPLVSVLTALSLDHTGILGETLAEISYEKCGIIKEGCPVVCMPGQEPEALAVIERTCTERHSPLIMPSEARPLSASIDGSKFTYQGEAFFTPMPGAFQRRNAAAAIETARLLGLSAEVIRIGLRNAVLPARMEVVRKEPFILLDGAHNPAGAAQLRHTLETIFPRKGRVAVMGMLEDKDCKKIVAILAPVFDRVYTCAPDNPRALSAEKLASLLCAAGGRAEACGTPEKALAGALQSLRADEGLVVCGSLYLASGLREILISLPS